MAVYFMNNNQRVIKVVGYEALREVTQTQELPDDGSLLKDMLTVSTMNDEHLDDAQYMAVESYTGNKQSFDMYRIVNQRTEQNWTTFDGVQLAYYELDGSVIEDIRPKNAYINELVPRLLKGTDWTLGYVDDNLPKVNTHIYYLSVKDALAKVQSVTGVEMIFKVEISGNQVTDKWVEVYERLGDKTLKRFNYGTNALTVVRETSHQDLYTALIGRGKGEEVSSAEDNASGQAGYGRKITFRDVEWSKANGKPLDKPKGQLFLERPEATAAYGIQTISGNKLPRVGIVEYSDTEDPNVLIQQTYEALEYYARPKVLFKASVVNIGATGIGDTVTIHRHDLNIHYETRVRKVIRDKINDNRTQVELGDVVHTSSTKKQANINSALNNLEGTIRDTARNEILPSLPSANGVNQNFYQNEEPERKRTGDLWYRDHPSLAGHRQLLMWNGEAWELLADTSDKEQVNRRIDEQEELLEEYSKDLTTTTELANDVSEKASQLEQSYQDVKASTDSAMNKAVDAYADAQSALASLQTIGSENIVPPFTSDRWHFIVSATEGVDYKVTFDTFEALTSRNLVYEVILDVEPNTDYVFNSNTDYMRWYIYDENRGILTSNGRGGVEDEVVVFNTEDNEQIILRIDTWSSMLSNVPRKTWKTSIKKGTVSTGYSPHYASVNEDISNAWNQAHQALENIDTLDQSVRLEFESIDGRLSSKAEQTTVNEINRTVQNQGSELLQAQNMIALKADQTDVDTLNQIIETNSAELSVLAGEISSKVDQQTVDNLNQTVDSLSAEQIIQADMISERLTRTEVNAEIERRVNDMAGGEFNLEGFAEVEYVENLIENTAESFSQSIESVRKLVPTEYENRNLVEDSREFSQLSALTYLHRATITEVNDKVSVGDTVTISFDVTADDDIPTFRFYDSNGSIDKTIGTIWLNNTVKAGTHRYSNTVTVADGGRGSDEWILDFYNQNDGIYFEVDNLKIEKGTVATDWSPAPEDLQNEVTILRSDYERTAEEVTDRLTKIDGNNGYISEIRRDVGSLTSSITEYEEGTTKRFNLISSDVRSTLMNIGDLSKNMDTRFTQTEEEMSLLVRSSDLISEINLQADRQIFRVGDNRLMITEDTTYLDNAVIKSAHIADLAVTGAKIADASISSAKIINLDADQITGHTTEFVKSGWNNISTQITIDDRGINITGNDQWRRSYFNQTGIDFFNGSGAYNKAGAIGYFKSSMAEATLNENVMERSTLRHAIGIGANYTHDIVFGFNKWSSTNRVFQPSYQIESETGLNRFRQNVSMSNNSINGVSTLYFEPRISSHNYEIGTWNDRITMHSQNGYEFYVQGTQVFNLQSPGSTWSGMRLNLNMNNNRIHNANLTNSSDERLKRNIMPSFKDSLGKFSKLEFKWFEYLENRGLAKGLHHGVMAQDVLKFAPEWVVEDEQGYYSLNQSAMLMDAFKAIMQLSKKVKRLEAK